MVIERWLVDKSTYNSSTEPEFDSQDPYKSPQSSRIPVQWNMATSSGP